MILPIKIDKSGKILDQLRREKMDEKENKKKA